MSQKNNNLLFSSLLCFGLFVIITNACQPRETPVNLSYTEPYRPQYHFTPASGWMNDPNGMVYYEGEYHLFYQHYPDSTVWGPMHWGHAVSRDLVHWEHLPIALYPDSLGLIFSGSVVVDRKNTSGLGEASTPPLVAIFTYHSMEGEKAGKIDFQTQGIAYSLDKGRTWKKYEQNPVLKNPGIRDFRDPKVSWHEPSERWVMALAVKDHVEFYASPDLKAWTKLSEFGATLGNHKGVWECPDLFALKDDNGTEKWALFVSINPGGPQGGSATQYFIGDFDGQKFTAQDTVTRWIDYGADNYAGVTWSGIPASDGRRLFIGWMSNWQYANVVPTNSWRSAMTLPREVQLWNRGNHYELKSRPVNELNAIKGKPATAKGNSTLTDSRALISFDLAEGENSFLLTLSNAEKEKVIIQLTNGMLTIDRSESGLVDFSKDFPARHPVDVSSLSVRTIDLYLDAASLELFVNDGERIMTELVFPTKPYDSVVLEMNDPTFSISYVQSIWNTTIKKTNTN